MRDRLPMTVIGGYLGAGKTTLINRLLAEPHGMRVMVLVNDFGAINIDAGLLATASEDTIELTNGCVCCTMGADLFMAIGDVLDRPERPDHLIIEASGIANPANIANAAIAEPELSYGGIVTVVDALNFTGIASDPLIAAQAKDQVSCADLLLVSKVEQMPDNLTAQLAVLSRAPVMSLAAVDQLAPLLLAPLERRSFAMGGGTHGPFRSWNVRCEMAFDRDTLVNILQTRPAGVFRMKGTVRGPQGGGYLVQIVGKQCEVTAIDPVEDTTLVAIGPAGRFDPDEMEKWWGAVLATPHNPA